MNEQTVLVKVAVNVFKVSIVKYLDILENTGKLTVPVNSGTILTPVVRQTFQEG